MDASGTNQLQYVAPTRAPWICSRCGTSHAPHVDQCYCTPNLPLPIRLPEINTPGQVLPPNDCGCVNRSCQLTACPRRLLR